MQGGRDKEASKVIEQQRQANLSVIANEGPLIMELAAGDWIPGEARRRRMTTEGTKTRGDQ